jgi:hypothetical protein
MSRNSNPPQLLTSIKSTQNGATRNEGMPASNRRGSGNKKEPDLFDPPVSSEDELASEPVPRTAPKGLKKGPREPKLHLPSSEDEITDSGNRAGIQPTKFEKDSERTGPKPAIRPRAFGDVKPKLATYGSARSSQESRFTSSQKSYNSNELWAERDLVSGGTLLADTAKRYSASTKRTLTASSRVSRQKRPKKVAEGKTASQRQILYI